MSASHDVGQRVRVADRFRHLLTLDKQVLHVHPDARERTIAGALALRDLILVMRKDEVDATRMEIDRRLAKQPERHCGALDMPAGATGAGPEVPRRLAWTRPFPEHEVARIVFDARPRPRWRRPASLGRLARRP